MRYMSKYVYQKICEILILFFDELLSLLMKYSTVVKRL